MPDRSFPLLVSRVIESKHGGNLLAASRACGVPQTSLWRWSRGMAQVPRIDLLQRFCEHYGFRFESVWELVSRDVVRTAAGKRVPLPDLSDARPGPKPRR